MTLEKALAGVRGTFLGIGQGTLSAPDETHEALTLILSCFEVPVAMIVSAHGDPEAFGEREIACKIDLRAFPYNTTLYAARSSR